MRDSEELPDDVPVADAVEQHRTASEPVPDEEASAEPPMELPWEHPLVQAMARGHEAATGATLDPPSPQNPVNFGAASDASFYEEAGIPAVVYGPGDLKIAHCRDEHVELDEVTTAAKALAAAVIDWCGPAS